MSDPLFAALTRPTMIMGVPGDAFKTLVIVSSIIFIAWKSLWSFFAFPVLYIPTYIWCYRDPNYFYQFWLKLKTYYRSTLRLKYNASSAAVFKPTRQRSVI